jgi:hypothetical protein
MVDIVEQILFSKKCIKLYNSSQHRYGIGTVEQTSGLEAWAGLPGCRGAGAARAPERELSGAGGRAT